MRHIAFDVPAGSPPCTPRTPTLELKLDSHRERHALGRLREVKGPARLAPVEPRGACVDPGGGAGARHGRPSLARPAPVLGGACRPGSPWSRDFSVSQMLTVPHSS